MKKCVLIALCAIFMGTVASQAGVEVAVWVQNGTSPGTGAHGGVNLGQAITTICIQYWGPTSGGGVTKYNEPKTYVDWAHQNGVKALLTVYNGLGGWNWELAKSAMNNANGFADALIAAMNAGGLDGIDLDLEGENVGGVDDGRSQYSNFINVLSGKLKSAGKMLTVCSFDDAPDPSGTNNVPHSGWWADWVGKAD
jgi:spore germination protein YaaH